MSERKPTNHTPVHVFARLLGDETLSEEQKAGIRKIIKRQRKAIAAFKAEQAAAKEARA